jgi:hypothetical protein
LLRETRLLPVILPELAGSARGAEADVDGTGWRTTLEVLRRLQTDRFALAFAVLLRLGVRGASQGGLDLQDLARRLRLTNEERKEIAFLLENEEVIRAARSLPWPRLQRILIQDLVPELLVYCRAVAQTIDRHEEDIDHCEQKLRLPPEVLNPPPLITGDDLRQIGVPTGPAYRRILDGVRDAQLEQRIGSKEEALDLARRLLA